MKQALNTLKSFKFNISKSQFRKDVAQNKLVTSNENKLRILHKKSASSRLCL